VEPRSCAGELFTEIYIPFHLMDGLVEESIELIGAAAFPAAAVSYLLALTAAPEICIVAERWNAPMKSRTRRNRRPILAISSGGGHWAQLMCLRPAWEELRVVYATVSDGYRREVHPAPLFVVPDGNLQTKAALLRMCLSVLVLVLRVRPAAVVTTGAAPGFFGVVFGKVIGAKTVWIDSIANADELSLSGRKVGRFADAWLTQWEHLTAARGPHYRGSVL